MVPTPPGWPVPQALRRSSASAPRTSPIGMRSGRRRSDERTRSESETTPSLVRSATRFGAAHCSSRVSSISTTRSRGLGDLGEKRVDEGRLAGGGAARDQDVVALGTAGARVSAWSGGHDAGGDIVVEREDRDGGVADREAGAATTGGSKSLEPLPVSGSSAETRGAPA